VTERKLNFSSGPAVLPDVVLRAAQGALWDLDGSGIGILEHSHRGKEFGAVLARTEARIRAVASIPEEYAVLFLTSGATVQFSMVPANFLGGARHDGPGNGEAAVADYCHTGVWSGKAIEEAKRHGRPHVACSSEAERFSFIPDRFEWSEAPRYVHFTSNNTIYGTQWAAEPPVPAGVPLVCDASSDLFSRPIDIRKYALIYASAQKNLGPPGVTVVIARKDFLERGPRELPPLSQYRTYANEASMHNTPNTFGVYVIGEVMQWILDQGGLPAMQRHNEAKAAVVYDFLDRSQLWCGHARPDSRSKMNLTFRGATAAHEDRLIELAEAQGLSGLRGHRSVGGLRASMYNAFPLRGAQRLVELLGEVERAG
jgi:phosphoserine aminotransferase